jgi:hypothetical protein
MLVLQMRRPEESAGDRHCIGCNYTPGGYHAIPDVDDCPVLRADAQVYDSHPDYKMSWRPGARRQGRFAGPELPYPTTPHETGGPADVPTSPTQI